MEATCFIEGCSEPRHRLALCEEHWQAYLDFILPNRPPGRIKAREFQRPKKARKMANGYWQVFAPKHPLADAQGYVAEHRFIAWSVGILTDPAMHVHHVNGDRSDNRPENLEALTRAEHSRRHGKALRLLPNFATHATVSGVPDGLASGAAD